MKYRRVFVRYILGTPPGARVVLKEILLCSIRSKPFSLPSKVYISTKSLKHAYDRRPDFTVDYLDEIYRTMKDPDYITENTIGKKGSFIFFKRMRRKKFLGCPVEISIKNKKEALFCVSFFPTKESYIKKSSVLWSREGGAIPPS